jgi:hypothetical protein
VTSLQSEGTAGDVVVNEGEIVQGVVRLYEEGKVHEARWMLKWKHRWFKLRRS